jgi:hypothetical protein
MVNEAFERVDVARQQLLLLFVELQRLHRIEVHGFERGTGALERAVHRRDARLEQLGHFTGLPPKDFAQDQHGSLLRRQVLERGDERETDRLAGFGKFGGVAILREHPSVEHGLDPRVLGEPGRQRRGSRRRRAEVHRTGAALRTLQHVETHVRGDAVEPRAERRPALEVVDVAPSADHRLLHCVLGLETRTEHPVAVRGQLPPVRLEVVEVRVVAVNAR